MLIPQFRCAQDQNFVRVEMRLSALCKVAEAQFDILERQFTFHCSPYFLRLTFPHELTEGAGERATYDVEQNILTVFLPKLNPGEDFPNLEFPNQLMATSKQRKQLVTEVDGAAAAAAVASSGSGASEEDKVIRDDDLLGKKSKKEEGEKKKRKVEQQKHHDDDDDDEDGGLNNDATSKDSDDDDDVHDGDSEMDALETEFDQNLRIREQAERDSMQVGSASYGFNNQFTRFFVTLDADLTRELLDLPEPDTTPAEGRAQLRQLAENAAFDEEAFLCSMEDEDDDVARGVLPFKPWYVRGFESDLCAAGRPEKSKNLPPQAQQQQQQRPLIQEVDVAPAPIRVVENQDEDVSAPTNDTLVAQLLQGQEQQQGQQEPVIWKGNTLALLSDQERLQQQQQQQQQPVQPTPEATAAVVTAPSNPFSARPPPSQRSTKGGLAYPMPPPAVDFTLAESTTLATIPRRNFLLHNEQQCLWALCDVLAATVYDILTTGDDSGGTTESGWTVTKLSMSLSWLDPPTDARSFAEGFCRRVLTYPLHRHFGVALRCLRDVSVLLLSGPRACVKVLLRTKQLVDGCDTGKHCISALWINPMLSWLTSHSQNTLHEQMTLTADQLHAFVVRGEEAPVVKNSSNALIVDQQQQQQQQRGPMPRPMNPLAWTSLQLPFSPELLAQVS